MQQGQPRSEIGQAARAIPEFEMFQHDPGKERIRPAADRRRHAHRLCGFEFHEPRQLGLEHPQPPGGVELDEKASSAALEPERPVDRAAAGGLGVRGRERRAGGAGEIGRDRLPGCRVGRRHHGSLRGMR
jgi:hypothetical protein